MNQSTSADLAAYLATLSPSFAIEGEVKNTIIELLCNCWSSLHGSTDQSTSADKIYRAENLAWSPPNLCFVLERHGGTVNGSSRAELHHWEVDVTSGVASIIKIGRRQLVPMAKRMDTLAKAQETAKLIYSRVEHPYIHWVEPGVYAVVNIGNVIPETNKQTTASRRKKYREQLEKEMLESGWVRNDQGNKVGYQFLLATRR